MKLCLILACVVSLTIAYATADQPSPNNAAKAAAASPKPKVIDVRTPEEYAEGHVNGAINLPVDDIREQITKIAPDKNSAIAVHCAAGGRSARAKRMLEKMGYKNVRDLGSYANAKAQIEGK